MVAAEQALLVGLPFGEGWVCPPVMRCLWSLAWAR